MSQDRRLHIALLTDGVMPYAVGGIQRHSRKLCEQLIRAGAKVTLYHTVSPGGLADQAQCLKGWDPALRDGLSAQFVPWPRGPWYPGHYLMDCHRYSRRLLEAFLRRRREERVDFIYAQGLTGMAFVGARKDGIDLPPVGINAHGYEVFQQCHGLAARMTQVLLRPAHRRISLESDIVFSFSGKIRAIVESRIGVPASRIREMPNAVDTAWIAERVVSPRKPRRFVFVGRYERRKGVEELTESLRSLGGHEWTMDFVGPIPKSNQLQHPRVRYLGMIRDERELMGIYDACDCIVAPSHAEGMPTVLIEAMSRGLTPIATDVGAVREPVLAAGGILIEHSSPSAIRASMAEIVSLTDDELYGRKCAARDAARSFTWDRVADSTIKAIEAYLAESKEPSSRGS
jgi:glycosyltransferase involved in cell wall biosynthesis